MITSVRPIRLLMPRIVVFKSVVLSGIMAVLCNVVRCMVMLRLMLGLALLRIRTVVRILMLLMI